LFYLHFDDKHLYKNLKIVLKKAFDYKFLNWSTSVKN